MPKPVKSGLTGLLSGAFCGGVSVSDRQEEMNWIIEVVSSKAFSAAILGARFTRGG